MAFQLDSNLYARAESNNLSARLGSQRAAESQQRMQANNQSMEANASKMRKARATELLNMATPENYGAIRQQAISEGLGSDATLPREYDEQFLNRVRGTMGASAPSSVREYQFFNNLSPEEQSKYLGMKRANKTLNLGGSQAVLDPMGGIAESFTVTPKQTEMPGFLAEQAEAKEVGKDKGLKRVSLSEMKSKLPQLMQTVDALSDLGETATYGYLGRFEDTIQRELGMDPGDDATARTEYMNRVNNQVLPLLRPTFGAAFTAVEGESLKATLGDPNMHPREKDAALRAFIEQKIADVEALERELGDTQKDPAVAPKLGTIEDGYVFNGGDPADPNSWKKAR